MSDDGNASLRRQLRFSLFLQAAAFLMFGVAFVVRATTAGFDVLTLAFALFTVLCAGAFVLTRSKMRQLG